jgi:type I restriction enzyme, R subunit
MNRNEAQTRRDLIDPKLFLKGWTNDLIKVEITPGGSDIIDGKPVKRKGRSDYLLCLEVVKGQPPLPVAVLEAKKEDLIPSFGLQQAQNYMKRFNVPFAFSSNGHLYAEYAEDTGKIIDSLSLDIFPTPDELRVRYEKVRDINLASEEAKALFARYKGGENIRFYFQDAAIRAALEKIAKGNKRVLLSLATGTGKTFIAKQLLYKLQEAGQVRRALFVCDRDELRQQGITHMQSVFGDEAREVTTSNPQPNGKILIATYHTLNVTAEDQSPVFWKNNFPPGYFSHIIIDECHRSAWKKWSVILRDNPDAVQIGLTATPRILKGKTMVDEEMTAHNIAYFGEPVYEYSITQGQEDGYLAACEVVARKVDIDYTVITKSDLMVREVSNPYTGQKPKDEDIDEAYTAHQYELKLMLDDRMDSMTQDLFQLFLDTGTPYQKTIIFCASDNHAGQIAMRLNNLYLEWCRNNNQSPKEMYAFRCTASEQNPSSKELIAELKGSNSSHFIATTVELLSTGVDIPNLNNVVFFKYIESPISFYQMVGRGTRIGEPRGSKMMFRIYDYTNATRLFGEPFVSRDNPSEPKEHVPPKQPRVVRVGQDQFEVHIEEEGKAILCEEDGKEVLVPYEAYKQRVAAALAEKVKSPDELRNVWVNPPERKELLEDLPGGEGSVRLVRELEDEQECDLYDVLSQLGWGAIPKTRAERASGFGFRNKPWLKGMPQRTQDTLVAIAGQFSKGGIDQLETDTLFATQEVRDCGGFSALLGLQQGPDYLINETKLRLLS